MSQELKDLLEAAKKEQEKKQEQKTIKKPSFDEVVAEAKRKAKEYNEKLKQEGNGKERY